MVISDFISQLATRTGDDPREIELYARRLREAGLFPDRTTVRKLPISASDAANLILALLAADHAAKAAEAVKSYSDLRPDRSAPAKSLIDFLVFVLEHAHSDRKLRQQLAAESVLSVFRRARSAEFRIGAGVAPRNAIRFTGPETRPPHREVEARLPGMLLVQLSFVLADLPVPHHLA